MADTDTMIATSIIDAVQSINPELPIYVKPNSELEKVANEKGQPIVLELFADRAYNKDLTLVPRSHVGSVITDPHQVAMNVLKMVTENHITTITGEKISVEGQTICVHGDTPSAVEMIRVIREKLEGNQIMIASSN